MLQHHPADEISQENLISDEVKMALDIKFRRELKRKLRGWRNSKKILENCDVNTAGPNKTYESMYKKVIIKLFHGPKTIAFSLLFPNEAFQNTPSPPQFCHWRMGENNSALRLMQDIKQISAVSVHQEKCCESSFKILHQEIQLERRKALINSICLTLPKYSIW